MSGLVAYRTFNKHIARYTFVEKGWLCVLTAVFLGFEVSIPYFVIKRLGLVHVNTVLPTISDAIASPPQNAIFSILVFLSAIIGLINFSVVYMFVHLRNKKSPMTTLNWSLIFFKKFSKFNSFQFLKKFHKLNSVEFLNKALITIGLILTFGGIALPSFPMGFREENEDWFYVIVLPHEFSSALTFGGSFAYSILFTYVLSMLSIQDKTRSISIKFALVATMVCSFIICSLYFRPAFKNTIRHFKPPPLCLTGRREFNSSYTMVALGEYIAVVAMICFTLTVSKDISRFPVIMTFTLDTHSKKESSKSQNQLSSAMPTTEASQAGELQN